LVYGPYVTVWVLQRELSPTPWLVGRLSGHAENRTFVEAMLVEAIDIIDPQLKVNSHAHPLPGKLGRVGLLRVEHEAKVPEAEDGQRDRPTFFLGVNLTNLRAHNLVVELERADHIINVQENTRHLGRHRTSRIACLEMSSPEDTLGGSEPQCGPARYLRMSRARKATSTSPLLSSRPAVNESIRTIRAESHLQRTALSSVILVGIVFHSGFAFVQAQDQDSVRPGTQAHYSSRRVSASVTRIDNDFSFDWHLSSPDVRIPALGFSARWTGFLLVQSPGEHRFSARTDGTLHLTIAGQPILDVEPDRTTSRPISLPAGLSPIELTYEHDRGPARVGLDWEGPGFRNEPIPSRILFHEDQAKGSAADRFEQGREIADFLGCANCHGILDLRKHLDLGPPLLDAGWSIEATWLKAWLANPSKIRPTTRMPSFGHSIAPGDSADLSAFLVSLTKPISPSAEVRMALNLSDAGKGRVLFRSLGCLGCHTLGTPATAMVDQQAPDLADLSRKRTADWVADYLARPKPLAVARHRPDLRLTADQSGHLAAFLVPPPAAAVARPSTGSGDPKRGEALVERFRCAACHEIPNRKAPAMARPLVPGADPRAGCLADQPGLPEVPRFAFDAETRESLRAFVSGLPRDPSSTAPETLARDSIRRRNCFGCHSRDGRGGEMLGSRIATYLSQDAELGALKGTLTPPNLSAVGDKLRPEYLLRAVRGDAPVSRPWLSVRMPVFRFDPGEAESIVAYLRVHDRGTTEEVQSTTSRPDVKGVEAATRLIGQRGFGCVSCHVLAGKVPAGGEPETLGPDLALAHQRMTERYFRRWISDPQRIIPGTPMPQFLKPIESLPGSLDDQLRTIWALVGSDRVADAAALGTREFLKRQGDRPLIVRDMVLLPGEPVRYLPRALAIGLANEHTLLFDTDRLAWVAYWHKGFLYRTKSGRLWEWHPEGEALVSAPEERPPLTLWGADGKAILPGELRERFGSFQELTFDAKSVTLRYRLNMQDYANIDVTETIEPSESGWTRIVRARGVPATARVAWNEIAPSDATLTSDGTVQWKLPNVEVTMLSRGPDGTSLPLEKRPELKGWLAPLQRVRRAEFEVRIQLKVIALR
jgi:cytochrome c2